MLMGAFESELYYMYIAKHSPRAGNTPCFHIRTAVTFNICSLFTTDLVEACNSFKEWTKTS